MENIEKRCLQIILEGIMYILEFPLANSPPSYPYTFKSAHSSAIKTFIKRSDSTFSHSSFTYRVMHVFNVSIPDKPLTNIELTTYAQELEIPHFRCVFMRESLPLYPLLVRLQSFVCVWKESSSTRIQGS